MEMIRENRKYHFQRTLLLVLMISLSMACSLLNPAPGTGSAAKGDIVVWQVWLMHGDYLISAENGAFHLNSASFPSITVKMNFSPAVAETSNGAVTRYNQASAPSQVEYQLCFSMEGTCEPQGEWKSLAGIETEAKVTDVNLDWRGQKVLVVKARFRDAAQKPLFSLSWDDAHYHPGNAPKQVTEFDFPLDVFEPATPTPLPAPAITQTYAATTSPVQGSIQVAPDTSIIGGTAGSTRQVPVLFSATSTFGKVTEMRVDGGDWEAFAPQKDYTITIALNWSTVQHCVEYRDEKGNVSPRYCDSKAVEGSPEATP